MGKEADQQGLGKTFLLAAVFIGLLVACSIASRRDSHDHSISGTSSLGAGTYERSIIFEGMTRTYRISVPPSYDKRTPAPLVIAFHGLGGTAEAQAKLSNLNDVSNRHGFIVVYPDGVNRSWNAGHGVTRAARKQINDVGFISALIDELSRDFHIDQRRVYATGMSNGAVLAHRLGCELSHKIAAIATVAGTMAPEIAKRCKPKRPVAVMAIHGTADPLVKWEDRGERGENQMESVPDTIKGWIERNNCPSDPKITKVGEDVIRETYAPCEGGTEVTLYRIEGGGHTWPGGAQYLPRVLIGKTTRALNASEAIWNFFVKHPMKE